MERRTYLRSLGVASLAGVAGCLGDGLSGLGSDDSNTVLDPPEEKRGDPSHPIHGEEFPPFSLPDPIAGETVSREDFVGEKPFLMTYFFTSCPDGACPALLLRLRRVQEDAAERGYEDDIALLAVTFDPERDTPETLEQYAVEQGVDLDAGNWHFLRPESEDEAKEVIYDEFGMRYKRIEDTDELAGGTDDANDGEADEDGSDDHGNETDSEHDTHDHGEYTFTHYNLITLVNEDGIVERAYPNAIADREAVSIETIVEDARTVVTD
ncbi:SCO family protein [Halosolutus halophilus]|uniref:SCO family protein n=1 Tax=Halosolutus halophilus TaxID=1552990 RepID=UPI00223501DE|nr:SCO family protein [Halosolutus halophilus]